MRISSRSIEQIRERADIVEAASEFTALRRQGARYTGLCPYPDHQEKTPSFSVDSEKGFYYCFGCQKGGDAIKLVSELRNLSFVESVEYLSERSGIELEYEGSSREDAQAARDRNERRRAGYRALAAAAAYYHKYLRESSSEPAETARRYIYDRGINESTIEEFRLGFAPPRGGGGFLSVVGKVLPEVGRKTLDEVGLLNSRGGERFAGRITFPISDRRGRIVGFGARSLGDEEPKYLNSPETELFNKRDLLYGFPQVAEAIRGEKSALVVEGYTDVLMLYQHGIKNAVATLGTAMTPSHIRTLSRDADEIYLLFDPDAAGERAIQRAMNTAIELSVDLRVLRLPEDPADWLHNGRGTPEQFREMVGEATPILEYSIRRIADRARGSDAMSRSRAVPEVKSLIQEIKDPVLHREAVRVASEALDVDAASLETRSSDGASGNRRSEQSTDGGRQDSLTQAGKEVLALILARPDLATKPLREGVSAKDGGTVALSAEDFADEAQALIFEVLREHVDGDLGDSLSDERLRPHMDLISSLSVHGERIYPSEGAVKVAWLRLRILRRERDKRDAEDFDHKDEIRSEIQALEKALRSAEAAAS